MTTRLSLAALFTVLWVGQAAATDRYVSPSGSGTACTPGSPCALSTANSSAQPGDVVRMADGTYSTEPVPSSTAATNTSPIRYIGNTANPGAVVVPSITDNHKPGVSWRAITINGTVRLSDASGFNGISTKWLKLDRCQIKGSLQIRNVSNSCVDSCSIDTLTNGQQNIIRIQPGDFDGVTVYEKLMDSDTLSNNIIKLTSGMASIPGDNQTQWVFYLRDCVSAYGSGCPTNDGGSVISNLVFDRNVVDIYCPLGNPTQGDWRPWYISTGAGTVFRRNRWTIRYYTTNQGGTAWRLRDKTHNVTWDTDTLIVIGNNGVIQMSSSSGGSTVQSDQHDNTWKNCFFDNQSTSSAYPPFNFQWGMVNVTLQRNTFKSTVSQGGEILDIGDVAGTANLIDHNTFVSFDPNCAPLTIEPTNWGATSSLTVTNNISYLPGTATSGSNQAGAVIDVWANRTFNLNNNLYAFFGKNSSPGDRAVRFRYNCGAGCTGYQYSAAGAGGALAQATGKDAASIFGSASFADSSKTNFNPSLNTGSAAIGRGTSGTDIGAVPFAGADVTPPSPVGGLGASLVTDQNIVLTWLATGDDGANGRATAYEMRYVVGSGPLNDGNFSSGTLVSGLPIPAAPGTLQGAAITNLTAGTTYTFGIRVVDEAGNWSTGSYLTLTTAAADLVSPAKIDDLGP